MELQFFKWKIKPAFFIIALLTLISFQTVSINAIFPNVPLRMHLQESILSGNYEAPYQYRLMKPFLGFVVEHVTSLFTSDAQLSHVLAYQFITLAAFLGIYILLYKFLKFYFTETTSIIGMMVFYMVIPLGMTGIWEEGDYFTVLFYLIGINLILKSKDYYLPLAIAAGAFNRDQIIFLLVFYACYKLGNKNLFKKDTVIVCMLSVASWVAVYYLTRIIFGFKESTYTIDWNTSENLRNIPQIIFLWSVMVLPFIITGALAYKKSSSFFKYSFLCVGLYIIIFFFNGFLTQMAKFLPAYLIFIPMSLQFLTKEYTGEISENNLIFPKHAR